MEKTREFTCPLVATCILNFYKGEENPAKLIRLFNNFEEHVMSDAEYDFYRQVTPVIVKSINHQENHNLIYKYLYEDKILPCINAILKGDFCFAYELYRTTILELENKYYYTELKL